jgi:hypothetical protein
MTEDEAKRYPIGSTVLVIRPTSPVKGKVYTVVEYSGGKDDWEVITDPGHRYWRANDSLQLVEIKSDVQQWFDDKLAPKQEVKKEWEPDKGINWEAYKGFMRNL